MNMRDGGDIYEYKIHDSESSTIFQLQVIRPTLFVVSKVILTATAN